MSQSEEEIIIIGGGKRPKQLGGISEVPTEYDRARQMIDEAEANGDMIRFEKKAAKP